MVRGAPASRAAARRLRAHRAAPRRGRSGDARRQSRLLPHGGASGAGAAPAAGPARRRHRRQVGGERRRQDAQGRDALLQRRLGPRRLRSGHSPALPGDRRRAGGDVPGVSSFGAAPGGTVPGRSSPSSPISCRCSAASARRSTCGPARSLPRARPGSRSSSTTFYAGEPFVEVCDAPPQLKDVAGTNYCRIFPHVDQRTGRIVVISVIDNLMKGASGQARAEHERHARVCPSTKGWSEMLPVTRFAPLPGLRPRSRRRRDAPAGLPRRRRRERGQEARQARPRHPRLRGRERLGGDVHEQRRRRRAGAAHARDQRLRPSACRRRQCRQRQRLHGQAGARRRGAHAAAHGQPPAAAGRAGRRLLHRAHRRAPADGEDRAGDRRRRDRAARRRRLEGVDRLRHGDPHHRQARQVRRPRGRRSPEGVGARSASPPRAAA